MKTTLLLVSFLFAAISAHGASSETVLINGGTNEAKLTLNRDVYRTEYRTEYYEDTCSREVYDGTYEDCDDYSHEVCTSAPPVCRYVCHQGPQGEICKDVCSDGGTHCRTEYSTRCETRTRYRTEYYSCTKSREVPYEVFDHYLKSNITVHFGEIPAGVTAKEVLKVALGTSSVGVSAETSKNLLLFLDKTEKTTVQANTHILDAQIRITFKDLKQVAAGIMTLQNIKLGRTQFSFESGSKDAGITLIHDIQINRHMFLNKSEKFSASLRDADFSIADVAGKRVYTYDLRGKGIVLKNGKFKFKLQSRANFGGKLPINASDLPLLNQAKVEEIKVNEKKPKLK